MLGAIRELSEVLGPSPALQIGGSSKKLVDESQTDLTPP